MTVATEAAAVSDADEEVGDEVEAAQGGGEGLVVGIHAHDAQRAVGAGVGVDGEVEQVRLEAAEPDALCVGGRDGGAFVHELERRALTVARCGAIDQDVEATLAQAMRRWWMSWWGTRRPACETRRAESVASDATTRPGSSAWGRT